MIKLINFGKYQSYLNVICRDFWRSYSAKHCINSYNFNGAMIESASVVKTYNSTCFVKECRQFKTWAATFTEESAVETPAEETKPSIDPKKDRTKIIPPEVSIRYMKSEAYKITYGNEPVWVKYRRNFKGQYIPKKTRKTCIRGGVLSTGNPCPICRDEYLVLDYTNVDLLKQFISPYTGEIHDLRKIHLCQKRLLQLQVAIEKAKLHGYLTYEVPFRKYNYSEYYSEWTE